MVDTPQVEASRSGLPWLSGMTGRSTGEDMIAELRRFEERRGRKVDISTCFANHQEGWEEYLDAYFWRNGLGEALAEEGVHIAMSIARPGSPRQRAANTTGGTGSWPVASRRSTPRRR